MSFMFHHSSGKWGLNLRGELVFDDDDDDDDDDDENDDDCGDLPVRRMSLEDESSACPTTDESAPRDRTSDHLPPSIDRFVRWLDHPPIVVPRACVPPSREAFREQYGSPHTPVILKGVAATWPAMERWDVAYMKDAVSPAASIRVSSSPSAVFPHLLPLEADRGGDSGKDGTKATSVTLTKMVPFWEYLDYVERQRIIGDGRQRGDADDVEYMYMLGDFSKLWCDGGCVATFSRLWEDVRVPMVVDPMTFTTSGIWVSQKGLVARCHYDRNGCHNLNVQVRGTKTFLLFPPNEFANLYGAYGHSSPLLLAFSRFPVHRMCAGGVHHEDEDKFPMAKGLKCYVAHVKAGESLFIPACWYHAVIHEGDFNVNVNFWWKPQVEMELPEGFPVEKEAATSTLSESSSAPPVYAMSSQRHRVFWNVHNMEGRAL